jgi:hypothetical protein
MTASTDDVERELTRVVDRLTTMPLTRAATAREPVRAAAEQLVSLTRRLGGDVPTEAPLPDLAPHALGSLIAVLGRDLLDAARESSQPDLEPALDTLVALRRSLP